jgi:hypothetical protein
MSGLPRVGSLRAIDKRTRPEIAQNLFSNEVCDIRVRPLRKKISL